MNKPFSLHKLSSQDRNGDGYEDRNGDPFSFDLLGRNINSHPLSAEIEDPKFSISCRALR